MALERELKGARYPPALYAAWLDGMTEADIYAIKQAMQMRPVRALPDARAAISAVNFAKNRVQQILIRPPESPEFGSRWAVGNGERSKPLNRDRDKVAERVGV